MFNSITLRFLSLFEDFRRQRELSDKLQRDNERLILINQQLSDQLSKERERCDFYIRESLTARERMTDWLAQSRGMKGVFSAAPDHPTSIKAGSLPQETPITRPGALQHEKFSPEWAMEKLEQLERGDITGLTEEEMSYVANTARR